MVVFLVTLVALTHYNLPLLELSPPDGGGQYERVVNNVIRELDMLG